MARAQQNFICQSCGAVSSKWAGNCEACGAWNSIAEEASGGIAPVLEGKRGRRVKLMPLSGDEPDAPRIQTGIGEFDRVCGGGIVPGSALAGGR